MSKKIRMSQEQHDEYLARLENEMPLRTNEVDTVIRHMEGRARDPSVIESLIIRLLRYGYVRGDGYTVPSPVSRERDTGVSGQPDHS